MDTLIPVFPMVEPPESLKGWVAQPYQGGSYCLILNGEGRRVALVSSAPEIARVVEAAPHMLSVLEYLVAQVRAGGAVELGKAMSVIEHCRAPRTP